MARIGTTVTSGTDLTPTRRTRRPAVSTVAEAPLHARSRPAPKRTRWSRRRGVLGVFAAFAAVGFVAAYIGPTGLALAEANAEEHPPISLYASSLGDVQRLLAEEDAAPAEPAVLDRDSYTVYVKPKPTPTPTAQPKSTSTSSSGGGWRPPFVTPDPGSAQAIAYEMVLARGWGEDQFACLVALWNKESGWRVNAYNAGSGAYGIPQSLPGSKMASAGADWETNPATQITWGLGYIGGRYGTPCGAWDHSQRVGWY
jgi:hypothetical protein